ncbi:MAG: hypothetical protein F6J94_05930 [Moorea sp. SIO1F2]|nr:MULTISPECIES: hypothetical protein [unclassified Moorena]NEN94551.1 hypothetical protein [Moorena sp. SIO3I7]NEO66540.1 hypothetical protein [Moorena sp. SIO4G2]NEO06277.1 hypothetical protein [Moorena sp. SIO3I8]NEO20328.1 hypothetical protein [Moorena sp. SIO4A5]NEP25093.1 hypothetical protein [Moorena sp. SIO3I6]
MAFGLRCANAIGRRPRYANALSTQPSLLPTPYSLLPTPLLPTIDQSGIP